MASRRWRGTRDQGWKRKPRPATVRRLFAGREAPHNGAYKVMVVSASAGQAPSRFLLGESGNPYQKGSSSLRHQGSPSLELSVWAERILAGAFRVCACVRCEVRGERVQDPSSSSRSRRPRDPRAARSAHFVQPVQLDAFQSTLPNCPTALDAALFRSPSRIALCHAAERVERHRRETPSLACAPSGSRATARSFLTKRFWNLQRSRGADGARLLRHDADRRVIDVDVARARRRAPGGRVALLSPTASSWRAAPDSGRLRGFARAP
jgi:hypothetical protein